MPLYVSSLGSPGSSGPEFTYLYFCDSCSNEIRHAYTDYLVQHCNASQDLENICSKQSFRSLASRRITPVYFPLFLRLSQFSQHQLLLISEYQKLDLILRFSYKSPCARKHNTFLPLLSDMFLYSLSRLNHTYTFFISVLLHKDRSTPTHFIQAKAAYAYTHVLIRSVT